MNKDGREKSFGQDGAGSVVDRFGVWLSGYRIRKAIGPLAAKRVGDFGCGYQATFIRQSLSSVESATLIDVALAEDLKQNSRVTAIEGTLPDALEGIPSGSLDVVLCTSVIEHLSDPLATLEHFRRIVRPGGVCAINVPSWLGKRALEFSAFRLGLSPACEMDDHKTYYDPRDLWPLLVKAGFVPHGITCRRHKFRLNTFAVCRVDAQE